MYAIATDIAIGISLISIIIGIGIIFIGIQDIKKKDVEKGMRIQQIIEGIITIIVGISLVVISVFTIIISI